MQTFYVKISVAFIESQRTMYDYQKSTTYDPEKCMEKLFKILAILAFMCIYVQYMYVYYWLLCVQQEVHIIHVQKPNWKLVSVW